MSSSSLFSQLDLGKRSLMAQQAGMNTTGHNIANIANENYSRQRVALEAQHPFRSRFGSGVDLKSVERVADRFLNQRVIGEQSRGAQIGVREDGLHRLENLMNDQEGSGLRQAMNEFWSAWGAVANNPENELQRTDLANAANTLARRISGLSHELDNLRRELNGRMSERVTRVNELAKELANLNAKLQQVDRGNGEGNDIRDQREATLKELSKVIQIDWTENDQKLINVNLGGGFPLVHGRTANSLEASLKGSDTKSFTVRGIDPKGISRDLTHELRSGELAELVSLRDDTVTSFSNRLDALASELALRVNRLHATGTGLNSSFTELHSSFALKPDARDRPLPLLRNGLFRLQLTSPQGDILETYEIKIDAGKDTLADVVKRVNAAVNDPKLLRASLNSDGSMSIQTSGPNHFILGQDDSDFTVLMGFNNFFESLQGASDFRLNPRLMERPTEISTGKGLLPGDNSVALAIQNLQYAPSMDGETVTFDEFYNGMSADLGLQINRAQNDKKNQDLILNQFQRLRDEVSSVNMDEEVAEMVQYQRGFDAAAKFVSTVDDMTKTVIQM
jgi:flagellar hook-associated protein 1 FlgK